MEFEDDASKEIYIEGLNVKISDEDFNCQKDPSCSGLVIIT